ncbi:MAG: DUF3300 domain-containing protein [Bryobacteraceae bacterium]|jgi:hypothetical protein
MKRFSAEFQRRIAVVLCALMLTPLNAVMYGQSQPPQPPPPGQALTPDQLDDLVAPVALYPDPLISQVLVAATYPLEVVQAFQWLQRNPGLTGPALTQAVQQQNWDPSVQALMVFPDVIKRLNDDVTWTTNLGNAFLAQQADVMDAVQRMRFKAQQAGKLGSTPQESVTTTSEGGQPIVEIEPANPDVIYVPVYNPAWVWGPPLWYPYPGWWWPGPGVMVGGFGFGFGIGINIGGFFGGGWGGWGGWGWRPGWGNHTVIVNNSFIHRYNFNTAHLANVHGSGVWQHDPAFRGGVPYSNARLNEQYRGNVRANVGARPAEQQGERFGNRSVPQNTPAARNGSAFGGAGNGNAARQQADHGYSSLGSARTGGGGGFRSAPSRGGGGRR